MLGARFGLAGREIGRRCLHAAGRNLEPARPDDAVHDEAAQIVIPPQWPVARHGVFAARVARTIGAHPKNGDKQLIDSCGRADGASVIKEDSSAIGGRRI